MPSWQVRQDLGQWQAITDWLKGRQIAEVPVGEELVSVGS
jgi:hypothetical protein